MTQALPLCCTPDAFKLLKRQVGPIESADALVQGAITISLHQVENVDPASVDAQLQRYADTVRSRVRGPQPQALMAHLHELLFEEEGFAGNTDDYYNTGNSYLPVVLQTKRGLPIVLSLLYKVVAERLGMRAWGVGLPGHFFCGVDWDGQLLFVDRLRGGQWWRRDEGHERMREMLGRVVGGSEGMLAPLRNGN